MVVEKPSCWLMIEVEKMATTGNEGAYSFYMLSSDGDDHFAGGRRGRAGQAKASPAPELR